MPILVVILVLGGLTDAVFFIANDYKGLERKLTDPARITNPTNIGEKLYGHVQIAFKWISLAAQELDKVVWERPDANPDIAELAGYLFRKNDFAEVSTRLLRLQNAGSSGEISNKDILKPDYNHPGPYSPGPDDIVSLSLLLIAALGSLIRTSRSFTARRRDLCHPTYGPTAIKMMSGNTSSRNLYPTIYAKRQSPKAKLGRWT